MNDKLNANRGALSFRKQVHALIFEHKIFSNHLQNMRFSLISACTFMRGDTVLKCIINFLSRPYLIKYKNLQKDPHFNELVLLKLNAISNNHIK